MGGKEACNIGFRETAALRPEQLVLSNVSGEAVFHMPSSSPSSSSAATPLASDSPQNARENGEREREA